MVINLQIIDIFEVSPNFREPVKLRSTGSIALETSAWSARLTIMRATLSDKLARDFREHQSMGAFLQTVDFSSATAMLSTFETLLYSV
jgi:hypothetical protein